MSAAELARRARFHHFMDAYHAARHAWELACEAATGLYAAEVAAFNADTPPMTFKQWLIQSAGMPR